MRDVILRGQAAEMLAEKHGADTGTYKPLVIQLSYRYFMMLSPKTQEGLLRTRFSNETGDVYIVIDTDLYDRIDITARQRIRCRGFGTPEEAVDFAIRNVGLLAALVVF